jgi:hypothetical protein
MSGSFDKLSDAKEVAVKQVIEEVVEKKDRVELSNGFFASVILICGIIMMVTAIQTDNFLALVPGSLGVTIGSIYLVSTLYDWLFDKS